MPPVSSEVISKLQKILARASLASGATEHEVQVAMQKAQQLAAEHNIDLATVDASGEVKTGKIETDSTQVRTTTKYERVHHQKILAVLVTCFDVDWVMTSYWTAQAQRVIERITFVGEKTDVQLASYCWDWLQSLFPQCWTEYRKKYNIKASWVAERSYYDGLAAGINESNKRMKEEISKSQFANQYAIVLKTKQELVVAKKKELFPNLRNLRTHTKEYDRHAADAGLEKGRSIKLNAGLSVSNPKTLR